MVQKFWRIRLGAAKEGYDRFEKVFDLCKNETTPCLAVGETFYFLVIELGTSQNK